MEHFDFALRCMEYDSKVMQLGQTEQEPSLLQLLSSDDSLQAIKESEEMHPQELSDSEDYKLLPPSFDSTYSLSPPVQHQPQIINTLSKRKHVHTIEFAALFYEEEEEESKPRRRKAVRHRRRRGDSEQYPTKNFLPNFKGPHLQYLEKQLGEEFVNKFEIIQIIKAKNGISIRDYDCLYKTPEFEDVFDKFFKTKVLYRELMLSRSSLKARKIHMKKIGVFEDSFYSKNFDRIN